MNTFESNEPIISVIIRTRNEERWIAHCIRRLHDQTIKNVEIVLVDNESTDRTIDRALNQDPSLTLVTIDKFIPGLALNKGVEASRGKYFVCLSAHCLPVSNTWLESMLRIFEGDENKDGLVAGVYGRQVPMKSTSALDARDLMITFGPEQKIQRKDPFFHNANSMIPRVIWNKYPFNSDVTNIEDRVWGSEVIEAGHCLVYEPDAAVYHHHGIHQGGDIGRAKQIVRIMHERGDSKTNNNEDCYTHDSNALEIAALVSLRDEPDIPEPLFDLLVRMTIHAAIRSNTIKRVFVSTDSENIADKCKELGAEVPFLRSYDLSKPGVRVDTALAELLRLLEKDEYFPDLVCPLEITHPFRSEGWLDSLVEHLLSEGYDTVIGGVEEFRPCWKQHDDQFIRIDDLNKNRNDRDPIMIGLPSSGCVTHPEFIRAGNRIGKRIGIIPVSAALSAIEVRSKSGLAMVEALSGEFYSHLL